MRPPLILGVVLLCTAPALAQNGDLSASFGQVTGVPIPVQSISGVFSSLKPVNPHRCAYRKVSGRVVSPNLILVKEMDCGRSGHDNVFLNVQFNNPADAAQMITGRQVDIAASFKRAEEDRDNVFVAEFLIAEKAAIVGGDPIAPPAPAFTSYMMCQPPQLDALAGKLGHELCVQDTLLANLAATGAALEHAAHAPAAALAEDIAPGDPDAITCRPNPWILDRHLSAMACAKGSYWAWYVAMRRDPDFTSPAPA